MRQAMDFICPLESGLKLIAHLRALDESGRCWVLDGEIFDTSVKVGSVSFTLSDYSLSEAETIARNIAKNPFMMRVIDEELWGEMD